MEENIQFYEDTILRKEFENLRKLQKDKRVKSILEISYKDRIGGVKSILEDPQSDLYPETFYVNYKMPMFVGRGQLENNWEGLFTITVNYNILMNINDDTPPDYSLDSTNGLPFNHHISPGWVCIGGVWSVAKDFGVWYFIIGIGGLLNQEAVWLEYKSGSGHLDEAALDYWNERGREPISVIEWPFDLREQKGFKIGNTLKKKEETTSEKPKIKIKGAQTQKGKIKIGGSKIKIGTPKENTTSSSKKITIKK